VRVSSRAVSALDGWLVAQSVRLRAARGRLGGRWRRVFHHHVRKTAGTSLNAAFWALAGLDLATLGRRQKARGRGLTIVRHDLARIARGDWLYANAHTDAHRVVLPPDTFTVTILRDPVARVRSLYRYLLWARDDPRAGVLDPYYTSLQEEAVWLGASFGEFLERVPPEHLERQLWMFSATGDVDEAADRLGRVDAVLFTESFADDLTALARRLGLPLAPRRERSFGADVTLSSAEMALARERLAREIALVERLRHVHGSAG
jgi:hypothetical protein